MSTLAESDPLDPTRMASLKHWGELPDGDEIGRMKEEAGIDCGWGRLLFGQTFSEPGHLVEELRREKDGRRDVAFYIRDPHVLISLAPQELFLDPSHTYRLVFADHELCKPVTNGFVITPLRGAEEGREANRILVSRGMIPASGKFYEKSVHSKVLHILTVKDANSGEMQGIVTGVDHKAAINDPDNGSSLWALAVDPQCPFPGVGESLVMAMALHFAQAGRSFMDLSVMHDNTQARSLYEKLGFIQVPVYCLKNKNCINEKLFTGPVPDEAFNIYARIIIDEARRRGIAVEALDAQAGYFSLSYGGRQVVCRESLSDMTSAIAMSRCQDKATTSRLLREAGLSVPDQISAEDPQEVKRFVKQHKRVVVKPANGEQGEGVFVDLRSEDDVLSAVESLSRPAKEILVEEMVKGEDLRIIVIGEEVVAAAVRRPAQVKGDGSNSIRDLIKKLSRRRAAATHGESRIPLDGETERCIRQAGYELDQVLPLGKAITVRKTANLHSGGTIHDVTQVLHPRLAEAAVRGARALDIPVVGFDFMVPSVKGASYRIIEANERPGLANHEPQPTVEKFIDLLFPMTRLSGHIC